jgi:hypothetical protein
MGLNTKNLLAHRIAVDCHSANEFSGFSKIAHFAELVIVIPTEKIRKQSIIDRGKRAERFEVSRSPAVALRLHAFDAAYALVRDQDMAQFSSESFPAFYNVALDNYAPAQSCADDCRDRSFAAVCAENRKVSPESSGVAVVQVDNGFSKPLCQILTQIKGSPCRMDKICGPLGT